MTLIQTISFLSFFVLKSFEIEFLKNQNEKSAEFSFLFGKNYSEVVELINKTVSTNSELKHSAYNRLSYLVDTYGPRLWGSVSLELVIEEMFNTLKDSGFENVQMERIDNMTHWVRGKESLTLYWPRPLPQSLKVIGLGLTVSGNVTGRVIVIKDFDELAKRKEEVVGKIVLFNNDWKDYFSTGSIRFIGPAKAAEYGAIACLVKSITPFSIESPHTGTTHYNPDFPQIPAAAISIEDADMFKRMQERGQIIIVNLYLEGHIAENRTTYNLVGDFKGSKYPDEIVAMGGHIDSWDVGSQTGANDNGGGFITAFMAIKALIFLNLRPLRTLRFIAWSGEEQGFPMQGGLSYLNKHKDEMNNHLVIFESDDGSTFLEGFGFLGGPKGTQIVKSILSNYLSPIFAGNFTTDGKMADNGFAYDLYGVPALRNMVRDTTDQCYYFTFHHSAGDTMSIMDANSMDSNVIGIAALTYIIADIENRFPRD